jgi:hypothetical protein
LTAGTTAIGQNLVEQIAGIGDYLLAMETDCTAR